MRSASSALRATVTVMTASTSGCTAIVTFCWPITLIGASSQTCGRLTAMPLLSNAATMSRTETEPNNWPDSEAWRMMRMSKPSIFSAALEASPLAFRLRASSSAFMPSNLARLSAVARKALPRLSRKLRANPSLTRTTSPIWPSLATRSSRITSMTVSPSIEHRHSSGPQTRRPAPSCNATANVESSLGEPQDGHRQNRPAEHDRRGINRREHERATTDSARDRMQDGQAEHCKDHEQACRKRAGENAREVGQERAGDGGGQKSGGRCR